MRQALLCSYLVLAACVTPQEHMDGLVTQHGVYCEKMGYRRDSEAWTNCLHQQDARAQQAKEAEAAAKQGGY